MPCTDGQSNLSPLIALRNRFCKVRDSFFFSRFRQMNFCLLTVNDASANCTKDEECGFGLKCSDPTHPIGPDRMFCGNVQF